MDREEAIRTVRLCCPKISNSECDFETAMRVLIPELRESEDERVRKAIRQALSLTPFSIFANNTITREQAVAWLEKQKEDLTPEEKMNHPLYLGGFDVGREVGKVEAEQKPAEPAGKLSREEYLYQLLIDQLITYSDYEYLTGKKPAEWSEEDENALNFLHELISFGFTEKFCDAQTAADMREWLNTRLKSLRPSWKPSEEQMKILEKTVAFFKTEWTGTKIKEVLNLESLYEQLKSIQ